MNTVPLGTDGQSWVLRQDGHIVHNNKVLFQCPISIQEGDVIGVTYDHIELKFYINNKSIEYEVRNVKGSEIYPLVYVDNGTIIDMIFSNFTYEPPSSYGAILIEKALL